jgi:GT2 family glycosyltransferase
MRTRTAGGIVPQLEMSSLSKAASHREPLPEAPVIVLNWNGWDHTIACLQSLRAAPDVTTVWLVDNGSKDQRFEEAATIWPGLRVLKLDQNYGFAGGMNRALCLAASEGYTYAYLLNNDCVVVPGFLTAVVEVACAENVAIVGSRVAYADTSNTISFDGEYHSPGSKPIDSSFKTQRVAHANGAGMLVKIDALRQHDFFDERFFCYHEEVDLCWRLAAAGLPAVVAAGSLVRHHGAGSDVDGNSAYYRTRNEYLLGEHFRGWRKLKRQLLCLYEASVAGRRATQARDIDTWQALAAAIDDGLHKRFGQRRANQVRTGARVRFRILCAILPHVGRVLSEGIKRRRKMRAPTRQTPQTHLNGDAPAVFIRR